MDKKLLLKILLRGFGILCIMITLLIGSVYVVYTFPIVGDIVLIILLILFIVFVSYMFGIVAYKDK